MFARTFSLIAILALVPAADASSFGFKLTAQNITLGKIEDKPIHVKAKVGQKFTLIAQGRGYPRPTGPDDKRAIDGIPTEPEEGKWSFDDKAFKVHAVDAKAFDKTHIVIQLEPTVVGQTRIRFNGVVGGYKRQFEVLLDVAQDGGEKKVGAEPIKALVDYLAKNGVKLQQEEAGRWVVADPKQKDCDVVVSLRTFAPKATAEEMKQELRMIALAYMLNAPARVAMSRPGLRGVAGVPLPALDQVAVAAKLEKLFKDYQPQTK